MNYTQKEWLSRSPLRKKQNWDGWKFFYAVAMEEIVKPNEKEKWSSNKSYLCRDFANKNLFYVMAINVNDNVEKGEIFICSQLDHLPGVERATGVMTFERPERVKVINGKDPRIARYLFKKKFKRERNIYKWHDSEISSIDLEIRKAVNEMNEKICFLQKSQNKKVEYLIKIKDKRIKTNYGIKKNLYNENFSILTSPFDMAKERICLSEKDFKKWHFINEKEIIDQSPAYPIYIISLLGTDYVCEKKDFELIENKNEKEEIETITVWETRVIELEKKRQKINRWLRRCLEQIEKEVYLGYEHYLFKNRNIVKNSKTV
jgi:hypothetical protein